MTDTTIRSLTAGGAISDNDLFISRQGTDTEDVSVTGLQFRSFINAVTSSSTQTLTNKSGNISQWTNDSGYIVNLAPYCAVGSGTDITSTIATVALTTEPVANANYSLSGNEITVTSAGTYQISYAIQIDEDSTGGGTRGRVTGSVENNATTITQSTNSVYVREASGGSGISNSFIASLSASDVIRLRVQQDGNFFPDLSVEMGQLSLLRVG